MMKQRLISIIIAVVCIALLAGCTPAVSTDATTTETSSTTAATTTEAKLELITLTMFSGNAAEAAPENNRMYKLIEEELGIKLVIESVVGDLEQKKGVMLASGDFPDLVDGPGGGQSFIDAGALIPLNEYITMENTPNMFKVYEPYFKRMNNPETGMFYYLPNDGYVQNPDLGPSATYSGPAFWLQKDVLIDAGYPELPKTLDEYFAMIEAYAQKHPEINGAPTLGFEIMADPSSWRSRAMKEAWWWLKAKSPADGQGPFILDEKTMKLTFNNTQDEAYAYYKKLCDMNAKNLVDKESFVQNYDEYLAKLMSNRVLGFYDMSWQVTGQALVKIRANGDFNRGYIPMELRLSADGTPSYRGPSQINSFINGFALTIKNKNPERTIQFLEALNSEEWQKRLFWGIEGEDYSVGTDGIFFMTDEQRALYNDSKYKNDNFALKINSAILKHNGYWEDGNAFSPEQQPSELFKIYGPAEQDLLKAYNKTTDLDFIGPAVERPKGITGLVWQSPTEGSAAAIASSQINDLQNIYLPQLIMTTPDKFDALWAEYVSEYSKIDVAAYTDEMQKRLDQRLADW